MVYTSTAKYTRKNYEVKKFSPYDKVNYAFFLLNYDVDKDQDVSEGVSAIKTAKDPTNLLSMLRNPKKIHVLIKSIIMLVLIISLVLFLITFIYVWYKGYELRKEMMLEITLVMLGLILFISLFMFFYNYIVKQIWRAYMILPGDEGKKNDDTLQLDD